MQKPYTNLEGEVRELDKDFFTRAKRGRPALPESTKKRRVNLMLDPDVVTHLQEISNSSAFVNGLLREKLGL
jgi:uncharacterized protein (DUF4415 family)